MFSILNDVIKRDTLELRLDCRKSVVNSDESPASASRSICKSGWTGVSGDSSGA